MNLTKNFSLDELLSSQTATRRSIKEQFEPSDAVIVNLRNLCENVLQPVRDKLGRVIVISSGYRCPKLNSAVGGASTSQHVKGEAADISAIGLTTEELYNFIINSGVEFDQIIQEFGRWVHVSFKKGRNRKMKLRAVKVSGRTKYIND
jgi:zinc D-Ala-D-Ala carboxypeptidase